MATTKRTQGAPFKARTEGEGRSTEELFRELRAGLRELETLMKARRNRDKASRLLTDSWTAMQEVAARLAIIGPHFEARNPRMEDEEDARQRKKEEEEAVGLSDLFCDEVSDSEQELDERMVKRVEDYRADYRSIESARAMHFRLFIDYLVKGARQASDVTANVLALARRVRPESLALLGVGQVDISRKLGEKRQTTSAREKRAVERTLKKSGAKGFKLLGGVRTEAHRESCRKSQKGNTSRRRAFELRRAAAEAGAGAGNV